VSTLTPDLLKEIALTIDLGERLTLIVVFGPGYLAEDGLAEIRDVMEVSHRVARHRLDRLGPNIVETVESAGASRPVVLVNGLERIRVEQREQVQASMNLLRDTLNKLSAAVVIWIPLEIADEFRRLCADLFHWRALTLYVDGPEHDERRLRHDYLVSLASATLILEGTQLADMPVSEVGELRVQVEGEAAPRDLDTWLGTVKRGLLRGPAGSGKTTALRRYAARRAQELLDNGTEGELPVLIPALWLDSREMDWHALARAAVPKFDEETRSWLARRLTSKPAILLMDGIDELPMYARLLLFQANFSALVADNPGLRLVLATRDWDKALGEWEKADVLPLEFSTVAAWLNAVGYDPVTFMDALSSAGAEGLVSTPLLLQIVSRRPQPPSLDLTSLITDMVASQLGAWDFQRGVAHRHARSRENVRSALAQFAADLTQNQRTTEGRDHLGEEMADVLDFVVQRTAIIQRENGKFGFVHEIFRDYFAGLWLAEQEPTPSQFANYAADPAWRLPTLHALWFLSPRDCETVVERIWEASDNESSPTRWAMRMLVLRATLVRYDRNLRMRFLVLAQDALEQARRDAEPPEFWTPVADLVEHMETLVRDH
jgi:hypothetical protein